MPPSRRRPTPQPPARRPKVAGLRRPVAPPRPEQPPEPQESTAEPDAAQVQEPAEVIDEPEPVDEAITEPEPAADEPAPADVEDAAEEPAEQGAEHEAEDPAQSGANTGSSGRPRPSGKRRAVGLRAPTSRSDLAAAERRSRADEPRRAKQARRTPAQRRMNLAIVLAVAALVCAALAVWFRGEANQATSGADTDNKALTDTAGTSELIGELRGPIESIFSVDYNNVGKTQQAADAALIGDAKKQYDQLFGKLQQEAPQQKLIFSMKIRQISATSLRGDTGEVLVFADQISTRAGQKPSSSASGAAFGIKAQRVGGHWKIVGLDMFDAAPVG